MCATSAISDYYQHQWPQRVPENPTPWSTDPQVADLLRRVVDLCERLDKRLGDVECKNAAKSAFIKSLEDAAAALKSA